MGDTIPTPALPTQRLIYLDWLRIVGMIDIVSNHAAGQYLLGGIGLPIFLLTSVAVIVRQPQPRPVAEVAGRRARAILIPWFFWSLAYLPLILWRAWRHGQPPLDVLQPSMLLYGTAIHLWFLPMILPANLSAVYLARKFMHFPVRRVIVGMTWIGAIVLLLSAYARVHIGIGPPFGQWLFSLACIPLGLALGRAFSMGTQRRPALIGIAQAAVLLTAIGLLGPRSAPMEWGLVVRFGISLLLIAVASMWTGTPGEKTRTLVRCTLGVYLVHPMLIAITYEYSLSTANLLLETLLMYFGSLAFVLLLRRTPLSRFV